MQFHKYIIRLLRILNWNTERDAIHFIKGQTKDKSLVGAEVGVYYGRNSLQILKTLPMKKLYLVDPYKEYDDIDGPPNKDFETIWNLAHDNLKNYKETTMWIRDFSEKAVKKIKDNSLDFVYIDGNHDYEFVKNDLKLWWDKVKPGGYLCGHDYDLYDVSKAVVEFSNNKKLKPTLGGYPIDWWIVKPELPKKK